MERTLMVGVEIVSLSRLLVQFVDIDRCVGSVRMAQNQVAHQFQVPISVVGSIGMFRTWLCLLVAILHLGFVSLSKANDNNLDLSSSVVGLPIAVNPDRPGAVVLHGGGDITDEVFERFCELAGGSDARIVFVPSAGYRMSDYSSEAEFLEVLKYRYAAWAELGEDHEIESFRFLYTDDPDDADSDDFVEPLDQATGVWFSGGAQLRLNYRFVGAQKRKTRFQQQLCRILERGGVIGGTSAGMAAMPEIMTLWQDRDNDLSPAKAVTAHGLGLFHGAIVEQHFDAVAGRFERFTKLLRDNDQLDRMTERQNAALRMVGLAVDEDTALVIQGDKLQSIGSGNSHVFLKTNSGRTVIWHTLTSGESGELVIDPVSRLPVLNEERKD